MNQRFRKGGLLGVGVVSLVGPLGCLPGFDATTGIDGGAADATADAVSFDAGAEGGCSSGQLACGSLCVAASDPRYCGSCSNDCSALSNVSDAGLTCATGQCSYQCAPGFADCLDSGTGCPTALTANSNCGACGHSCLGGTCKGGQCQPFVLTTTGATSLFVDDSSLYLDYVTNVGANLATVNKVNGMLGPSALYDGTFAVAQDASQFYLLVSQSGGGSKICILNKSTMKAVGTCLYGGGASGVAIGVSGTQLWWVDSTRNLWGGTTTGATAMSVDGAAGSVLAADSAGLVWTNAAFNLLAAPVSLATRTYLQVPSLTSPQAAIIDASYVYWYNGSDSGLYRSGRNAPSLTKLATLTDAPAQLALDSTDVYWTDPAAGEVWRVPIVGGAGVTATPVATGQANVSGVAVDSTAIYWSMYDSTSNTGQLLELAK
jgi:hypothetical protein